MWRCCAIGNYRGYKPKTNIYLVTQPVDFRKSINGLTALIQEELGRSPMENACFVFSNNQRDGVK